MSILQWSILITYALYIIISIPNFMDSYSIATMENFKSERNWKIGIATMILFIMFLGGVFELS